MSLPVTLTVGIHDRRHRRSLPLVPAPSLQGDTLNRAPSLLYLPTLSRVPSPHDHKPLPETPIPHKSSWTRLREKILSSSPQHPYEPGPLTPPEIISLYDTQKGRNRSRSPRSQEKKGREGKYFAYDSHRETSKRDQVVICVLEHTYRHMPGQPFWAVVQVAGTVKLLESLRQWEEFEREEVRQLSAIKREMERLKARGNGEVAGRGRRSSGGAEESKVHKTMS